MQIFLDNLHTGLVKLFILGEPLAHFTSLGQNQGLFITEMFEPQLVHILQKSWSQRLLERRGTRHSLGS